MRCRRRFVAVCFAGRKKPPARDFGFARQCGELPLRSLDAKDPAAAVRYGEIAAHLGLAPTADALVKHIRAMNKALDIPDSIKDYEGGIIDEKNFSRSCPAWQSASTICQLTC